MKNRWAQFGFAVTAMVMIANLQYAWTAFVKPIECGTGWSLSKIQWGLTVFILFETWMAPLEAWLVDRLGPSICLLLAGVLCGVGWSTIGFATTLSQLYVCYSLAGIGAALVYSAAIGTALKWFPDRRGFVSGLMAAGFGGGSAIFLPLIIYIIRVSNYRTAFLYTGISQASLILVAGAFLRNPERRTRVMNTSCRTVCSRIRCASVSLNSIEMLRTPHFYVMYAAFALTCVGGLMVTAQAVPVAESLNVHATGVVLSLSLSRVANGAGRVFWGWVSDHIGREIAMIIPFTMQGSCLIAVQVLAVNSAVWFTICLISIYFMWGSIFSLFPAIVGDYFGARHASSNYGFLYTAKGVASIAAGGVAAWLFEIFGNWNVVFTGSAVLAILSGLLILGLRSMVLPSKTLVSSIDLSTPVMSATPSIRRTS